MDDDDKICLCFHVTKRKVIQYIRVNQPTVASQLTDCYGAGSGCGWCRPFLKQLVEQANPESVDLPDPKSYATERADYRKRHREPRDR